MAGLISRDDVRSHPAGEPLLVPRGTIITPGARDEAAARRIELRESAPSDAPSSGAASCGCDAPPEPRRSVPPARTQPSSNSPPWSYPTHGVDPALFRNLLERKPASKPTAPAPVAGRRRGGSRVRISAVGSSDAASLCDLLHAVVETGGHLIEVTGREVERGFLAWLVVEVSAPPAFQAELERRISARDVTLQIATI